MKHCHDKGSMMVEAVLVMPIFVLMIFFLIQICLVWTAKQLTYYAAYCSARAAMVYNPAEYNEESGGGVAKAAACQVLSYMSWSTSGFSMQNVRAGDYEVPLSSNVRGQVSVKIEEYGDGGKSAAVSYPAVKATVTFKFPLFIPFGGPVVAYFFGASMNGVSTEGSLSNVYTPTNPTAAVRGLDYDRGYYKIPLVESCTLAKPYRTETFPLSSSSDKTAMGVR